MVKKVSDDFSIKISKKIVFPQEFFEEKIASAVSLDALKSVFRTQGKNFFLKIQKENLKFRKFLQKNVFGSKLHLHM